MIVLDTDVCIGILHGDYTIDAYQAEFGDSEQYGITTLSIYELYMGLFKLQFGKNKIASQKLAQESNNIEKLINSLQILNLTKEAAIKGAEIYRKLESEGETLGQFDCIIGAIVLILNEGKLLSNNIKHFKKIPGIKLVTVK